MASIKEQILGTKDGQIVLLHDIQKKTLDAIRAVLPRMKEKNIRSVTLSEVDSSHR